MTSGGPQERATAGNSQFPGIDTTVANPARVWNYWVGGKDNFAVDRETGEQVLKLLPTMPLIARYARRFLLDAVGRLSIDYGIRQFLDIGTGLPTADNTHEDPYGIVSRLMDALPPGSYLGLVHAASDIQAETVAEGMGLYNERASTPITMRTRAQVARFFDGLDLVEPGLVPLDEWWPPGEVEAGAAGILSGYAGIARKR